MLLRRVSISGPLYVDCAEDNTETQAISSLAAKLNDGSATGISVPHTGLSTSKYYKLLWKTVDAQFDSVIVILDEIDLMNDDSVLMKLSRAEEAGKIDCSVGPHRDQQQDPVRRQRQRAGEKQLPAQGSCSSPYDANQLREIMFNREDAFQNGVLPRT